MTINEIFLEVKGLRTQFFTDEGVVKAVDGADFRVRRGKTVCLVGESGCGKSVTARSILQIVDKPGRIVLLLDHIKARNARLLHAVACVL